MINISAPCSVTKTKHRPLYTLTALIQLLCWTDAINLSFWNFSPYLHLFLRHHQVVTNPEQVTQAIRQVLVHPVSSEASPHYVAQVLSVDQWVPWVLVFTGQQVQDYTTAPSLLPVNRLVDGFSYVAGFIVFVEGTDSIFLYCENSAHSLLICCCQLVIPACLWLLISSLQTGCHWGQTHQGSLYTFYWCCCSMIPGSGIMIWLVTAVNRWLLESLR